ncbi:MAG: hypothetical protein H4O13_05875 [Xanthomonadales bacterium]|nr:hypothetical protein [Xanthomonadales bacterium]
MKVPTLADSRWLSPGFRYFAGPAPGFSEFMLVREALHRFTARKPLYRVHKCVFGVLALDSESVAPRP